MVETAIVMPLFVFILLGILQLSLMHQARLMTKYAAYKAARSGSIGNAKMLRMEKAALAVLLPFVNHGSGRVVAYKTRTASDFAISWLQAQANTENGLKHVEVTICGPTKKLLRETSGQANEYSFDDPATSAAPARTSYKHFDRTRLAVQVTFNYRMVIPFANMLIWAITYGEEQADTLWLTRTGPDKLQNRNSGQLAADKQAKNLKSLASQGIYVLPIRADWMMRMQSNLFPEVSGYELPEESDCIVRFPKLGQGGSSGGGTVDVDDEGTDD